MGMFVHPPFSLFSLVDVPIDVRISPSSRTSPPPPTFHLSSPRMKIQQNLISLTRPSTPSSEKPTKAAQSRHGTSISPSVITPSHHARSRTVVIPTVPKPLSPARSDPTSSATLSKKSRTGCDINQRMCAWRRNSSPSWIKRWGKGR